MRLYLTVLLGVNCIYSFSQSVQNIKAVFQDGRVSITYDLIGKNPSEKFLIEVTSSHNNHEASLEMVTGDVNKAVLVGTGKKIIWDAQNELDIFEGEILFKVLGRPSLTFLSPTEGNKLRIGKKTTIAWAGGLPNQNIKLVLMQGAQIVQTIGEATNRGTYTWAVSKTTKKGSYTIKITSGNEATESNVFTIKRKVPVLAFVLPAVGIGAAVIVLGGGASGGSSSNDLPGAPGPK